MEIVLVKWEDAFGCPEGWQMLDEVERETSLVQSVGFVAAETETTLTIVPHVGGLNRETQQAAGAITLPKRQIISVCRCEVAPPPAGQSASGGSSEQDAEVVTKAEKRFMAEKMIEYYRQMLEEE